MRCAPLFFCVSVGLLSLFVSLKSATAAPRITWLEYGRRDPFRPPDSENVRSAHLSGRSETAPGDFSAFGNVLTYTRVGSRDFVVNARRLSNTIGQYSMTVDEINPLTGELLTYLTLPRGIGVSLAGNDHFLFVLAIGSQQSLPTTSELFRVDLVSGEITRLAQVYEYFPLAGSPLIFDEGHSKLYFTALLSLYAVDATTGAISIIRDQSPSSYLKLSSDASSVIVSSGRSLSRISIADGSKSAIYTIENPPTPNTRLLDFVEIRPDVFLVTEYRGDTSVYLIEEVDGSTRTVRYMSAPNATVDNLRLSSDGQWLFWSSGFNAPKVLAGKLSENLATIWQLGIGTLLGAVTNTPDDTSRFVVRTQTDQPPSILRFSNQQPTCCSFQPLSSAVLNEKQAGKIALSRSDASLYYIRPSLFGNYIAKSPVDTFTARIPAVTEFRAAISDLAVGKSTGTIYFGDRSGIYKTTESGPEAQLVATSGAVIALAVSVDESSIYWLEESGAVRSLKLANSAVETLPFALKSTVAIGIDTVADRFFSTDGTNVVSRHLDNASPMTIFTSPATGGITSLSVDQRGSRIYVASEGTLRGMTYDGAPSEQLLPLATTKVFSIAVADSRSSGLKTVRLDYNGSGASNHVIFRQSSPGAAGNYYIQNAFPLASPILASRLKSIPIEIGTGGSRPADITMVLTDIGDGLAHWATREIDLAVWGVRNDIAVPEDYDGDSADNLAVYRPREPSDASVEGFSNWYVLRPNGASGFSERWGLSTDIPVPADYDGDGVADFAVFRPRFGQWYIKNSGYAYGFTDHPFDVYQWGLSGDVPLPGDRDNDGFAELIVWRPSSGTWYLYNTRTQQQSSRQWGLPGDVPLLTDFNGDGMLEFTVYREKPFRAAGPLWYTNFLDGTTETVQWGLVGDKIPLRRQVVP